MRRIFCASVVAIAIMASCQGPTQVTVSLRTTVAHREGMRAAVTVGRLVGSGPTEPNAVDDRAWGRDGDLGTLVVIPEEDKNAPLVVVAVLGVARPSERCDLGRPDGCIVARRRLTFLKHRALRLPIVLHAACEGVACADDSTCNVLGQCVSADVDSEACSNDAGCVLPGDEPFLEGNIVGGSDAGSDGSLPDAGPFDAGGTDVGSGDAAADAQPIGLPPAELTRAAYGNHTCARWSDGRVKCWGSNPRGELGLGDTAHRGDGPGEMGTALPFVDLGAGRTAKFIASGGSHTCAILDNDQLKCWGLNYQGMLGLGDMAPRGDAPGEMGDALPIIPMGTGRFARTLGLGAQHSCAVTDNGLYKCWGENVGQLGLGDSFTRGEIPGQMGDALPGGTLVAGQAVLTISGMAQSTCALIDNGQVKCWGTNFAGQHGLGDIMVRGQNPGEVGTQLPAVDLGPGRSAKGLTTGGDFVCVLLDDDRIKCWGRNGLGQLGLGDNATRGDNPGEMGAALPTVDLGTGRTAKAVSAGVAHACALLDNGRVKCWGRNNLGNLGVGDNENRGDNLGEMGDALPFVDLGSGRTAASLFAGNQHTCVILDNGGVKCWGGNGSGELGLGDTIYRGGSPSQMGNALPYVDLGR